MTGQTLLDYMEILLPELQLQSGESDVTKGLKALNAAQDWFEAVVALHPGVLGGQTGDVTTTLNTETTAFPAGLLRVDKLQYIDAITNRPAWDLDPIYDTGGHAPSNYWPFNVTSSGSPGIPRAYWTNGTNFYWDPVPDGTRTIRYYGFKAAADITAVGTFAYPDIVALPLATFAARLLKLGLDDPVGDLTPLASEVFEPTISALSNFRRERPQGYQYRYRHDT
jgi:hypothetical protein